MKDDNLPVGLNPDSLETHKEVVSNQEQPTESGSKFEGVGSQIPSQSIQKTVKTPLLRPKSFARIFIIFFVFILLILGSLLGYYYFAVYDQERFAHEVLGFFEEIEKEGNILNNPSVKDDYDYQGAIEILQKRKEFFQRQKEELSEIRPPFIGPYKSLTSDFSEAFEVIVEVSGEAEDTAEFMIKVTEFKNTLQPETSPFSQPTPTIREVQTFYNEQIPKFKKLGDELFANTSPPKPIKTKYSELKTSWAKTKPALDSLLVFINSLDPNLPLDSSKINQPESEQFREASEQINSFGELLDEITEQGGANSLLTSPFSEEILRERLGDKTQEIQKQIDELKEKYGKN